MAQNNQNEDAGRPKRSIFLNPLTPLLLTAAFGAMTAYGWNDKVEEMDVNREAIIQENTAKYVDGCINEAIHTSVQKQINPQITSPQTATVVYDRNAPEVIDCAAGKATAAFESVRNVRSDNVWLFGAFALIGLFGSAAVVAVPHFKKPDNQPPAPPAA